MTIARPSRPRHGRTLSLLLPVAVVLAAAVAPPAAADERLASVGFYVEAGAGGTGLLGDGAEYSAIGPSFELRGGYEPLSWLSLGGYLFGSTHEATVPPPPEGEYFQVYGLAGDVRLSVSLGPIAVFADGGAGVGVVSSNVLARVDILEPGERASLLVRAGGGLEYQLLNRHYAFGLAGQWMAMPQFASLQGVSARLYLRYTY